jgi:dienelactone hydrolase
MVEGGACPSCIGGFAHDGQPQGTIETVAKLQTYIAKPTSAPAKPGIILIIPDAFGLPLINNKLLADDYAERTGRTVYLPDFMFGVSPTLC